MVYAIGGPVAFVVLLSLAGILDWAWGAVGILLLCVEASHLQDTPAERKLVMHVQTDRGDILKRLEGKLGADLRAGRSASPKK